MYFFISNFENTPFIIDGYILTTEDHHNIYDSYYFKEKLINIINLNNTQINISNKRICIQHNKLDIYNDENNICNFKEYNL